MQKAVDKVLQGNIMEITRLETYTIGYFVWPRASGDRTLCSPFIFLASLPRSEFSLIPLDTMG